MKLKYALIALFGIVMAGDANASRDAGFEHKAVVEACELNQYQSAVRDERWNKLAMRYFFASMDNPRDPVKFERIKREVSAGVTDLRREFGTDCVLEIR